MLVFNRKKGANLKILFPFLIHWINGVDHILSSSSSLNPYPIRGLFLESSWRLPCDFFFTHFFLFGYLTSLHKFRACLFASLHRNWVHVNSWSSGLHQRIFKVVMVKDTKSRHRCNTHFHRIWITRAVLGIHLSHSFIHFPSHGR